MAKVKLGIYRHYKGKLYEVVGVGRHSDTLESVVIYRALYDHPQYGKKAWWVRPLADFTDKVRIDQLEFPRFKLVESKEESK